MEGLFPFSLFLSSVMCGATTNCTRRTFVWTPDDNCFGIVGKAYRPWGAWFLVYPRVITLAFFVFVLLFFIAGVGVQVKVSK